jgi:hypothetical protein
MPKPRKRTDAAKIARSVSPYTMSRGDIAICLAMREVERYAAEISPYTFRDQIPLTAPEVLAEYREALRTYQDLPKSQIN